MIPGEVAGAIPFGDEISSCGAIHALSANKEDDLQFLLGESRQHSLVYFLPTQAAVRVSLWVIEGESDFRGVLAQTLSISGCAQRGCSGGEHAREDERSQRLAAN